MKAYFLSSLKNAAPFGLRPRYSSNISASHPFLHESTYQTLPSATNPSSSTPHPPSHIRHRCKPLQQLRRRLLRRLLFSGNFSFSSFFVFSRKVGIVSSQLMQNRWAPTSILQHFTWDLDEVLRSSCPIDGCEVGSHGSRGPTCAR
jgi:hypothetical protein